MTLHNSFFNHPLLYPADKMGVRRGLRVMLKESITNIIGQLCDRLKGSAAGIKGLILSVRSSLTGSIFKKLGNWRFSLIFITFMLGMTVPYLLGTMYYSSSIPSGGMIKAVNVGVYSDSGCTTPIPSITWGVLEPGGSQDRTIYIKNNGNSALVLSLNTEGWSPLNAADYIDLSWNYTGEALNPGASIDVVLTLTVSSAISGIESFNFNIVIVGTG